MVLLMATLFWALWTRTSANVRGRLSARVERPLFHVPEDCPVAVERLAKGGRGQRDYQKLKQDYESASQNAAPRIKEINLRLRDLSAKILAVQNVFTDRRAYVNALTYSIETEPARLQKRAANRPCLIQKRKTTVAYPTVRSRTTITRPRRNLQRSEKRAHQLSAELGE